MKFLDVVSKKIIMAGLANSKTSLGEIFRRYINCFKVFSNPDVFDLTSFTNNKELYYHYYDQYHGPVDHDVKYFHTTTNLYRCIKKSTTPTTKKEGVKKIGYFVWESSELHDQDADVLKDFDEIWTASNYCKDIFSQYVNSDNIKVIPHPIPIPEKLPKKYKNFTILIMGNISSNIDRKNISDSIKVAKLIKEKYKNVNIIFKTFTASDDERILLKHIIGNSNIKVIDEYYSSEKIQNLLARCHVLLSLHRSEGFGLTLAEALACNTIPLATGYSGNTDFMKDVDLLVDYKLVDVSVPYFKGQWAEPDKDDAFNKLENIIHNYHDKKVVLPKELTFDDVNITIKNLI
jgi:glycosyltransferase involved in cell wall biosynthesis